MNDHHNALPAGYRLGEYEIQTVLGSGGFGVTYKAHDHNLDKLVAIKEYLPPDFAVRDGRTTVKPKSSANKDDYEWGLDRFLDEARTLARFDHPHINRVYRFFKENGTAYLVLEYIEGDLLSDLLKDKGRFNEAGIQRMLDELLDGLDAVHSAGYIHRDIKPANIIFRRDGGAVLLDFGAARQAIGQRSQMITSILTRGYAPVEQYLDTVDAMGAWSDLYSLGVVAYRCLVGGDESVVIDAPSRAHFAKRGQIDKDMPPAVKVGKGNYSASLLSAIDWAMQVEESDRPQSVAEMQAVLAGEGDVEVGAASPVVKKAKKKVAKKVTKKVRAKRAAKADQTEGAGMPAWAVVVAGLGLAAVVIFGVSQYEQWHEETIADEQEQRQEETIADEQVEWLNLDCDNESAVRAYLEKYPDGIYRAGASACQRKIVAAARAETERAADAELANEQAAFRRLVGHDADASSWRTYSDGKTDLHVAVVNNWVQLTRWLIAFGADLDAQDNNDRTPLHYAASINAMGAAKLLLVNGAYVNAEEYDGWRPLDWALNHKHSAMQSLLRRHGGRCNKKCQ